MSKPRAGSKPSSASDDGRSTRLEDSPMMARLVSAMEAGEDIGHYGRLVFAMVARHFVAEDELVSLLARQPGMDEEGARTLVAQVVAHDYNPPKRERILEWQQQQDYVICPDADDPQGCNVYRELRFPDDVYESIEEFWTQKESTSENN